MHALKSLLASAGLILAVACTPMQPVPAEPETKPVPGTVTALQLNIWQEGTQVPNGFQSLVDEVLASKADLIALSEVRNYQGVDFIARLTAALNQRGQGTFHGSYVGGDTAVLSRYPVKRAAVVPSGSAVKAEVDVNGQTVVVYSVHLDYTHYACYLPRGYQDASEQFPGWDLIDNGSGQPSPVTDLQAIRASNTASSRQRAIQHCIADAKAYGPATPMLLMGDFNEPSHLDWVEANKGLYDRHGVVYAWDTTRILEEGGFLDAYRVLHPSPLTHPGFTWPAVAGAGQQGAWLKLADERDRIDFVFYRGGLSPQEALVWGPEASSVKGATVLEATQDRFGMGTTNWPSDHKGVRVTFALPAR